MAESIDRTRRRKVSREELDFIANLHRRGCKSGEISEELWHVMGIFRSPGHMRKLIKRATSNEESI